MANNKRISARNVAWIVLAGLGSGCMDEGLSSPGQSTVTESATDTDTVTATATFTVGRTAITTVTATKTASTTDTASTTSTSTTTDTTPTGTNSATSTGTGTQSATSTVTVTVTSTFTTTGTAVTTTATTTSTSTETVTKISTLNGYTAARRTLPPLWACPKDVTGAGGAGGSSGAVQVALEPALTATDCKSLAGLRKPLLKAESKSRLEQIRAALVAEKCSARTEEICLDGRGDVVSMSNCRRSVDAGTSAGGASGYSGAYGAGGATPVGGAAGSTGATQYSTTNTQVASVDEADYVKNDGNTIYLLGSDGLHVIDAWPAEEMREITRVSLAGVPRRMFLLDNRLVVYSRGVSTVKTGSAGASNPSDQGCTYGYACRFSSEGGRTIAQVFDVSTPSSPVEIMRYEMSGGYVASRRVGSHVYTVVHDTGATQVAGLNYDLRSVSTSYEDMQAELAQMLASNFALIDASADEMFLPSASVMKPGGSAVPVTGCQYALATQYAQGGSFLSINTFDLTTLEPPSRTIVASNAGYVYASASSLYVAVDRSPELGYSTSYRAEDSFVHKFRLDGADTAYEGSVALPGHILNQFAMDESSGVLHVASTRGWVPSPTESFVTTFGDQSGTLVQLGQVGGIGPGEDIRSVRFDGDRGYVVTFKKTDPLFVFDLSNAATPTLMGELKIPGFSTYMQRLDAKHVLSIGFEADEQGSFAYFNGIQIQIFDVSNLADPKLAWKTVIGTRGTSSEALTNHLAFNYFAPKKMLVIPVTICEGGGNGGYGTNLTFTGLMAFDVSLDKGIVEHGRLPFLDPKSVAGTECSKWWTDSKSLVKRSIFMDDFIYGLSDAQLRAANLASMSAVVSSVSLTGK